MNKRLTPSEIIENNKVIIKDNNLTNLNEIIKYTLKIRLENKGDK
jgi:hypothetical protein